MRNSSWEASVPSCARRSDVQEEEKEGHQSVTVTDRWVK